MKQKCACPMTRARLFGAWLILLCQIPQIADGAIMMACFR